jgi:hypothetical protein
MVKFDFKPNLSKNGDWFFESLYENLKERNKLKKFLEIEKKNLKINRKEFNMITI